MNKPLRTEAMTPNARFTPDDTRAFRDALGQFATGVAVIATQTEDGPVGMTVNSFASVSLDPALVLWSIAKDSNRYDVFATAKHVSINILKSDQGALAGTFAKNADAFSEENSETVNGRPVIKDALAVFECTLHTAIEGGDHTILLSQVDHVTLGSGAPLVFHQGKFGGFSES